MSKDTSEIEYMFDGMGAKWANRRVFTVRALHVNAQNLAEISETLGELSTNSDGVDYIQVSKKYIKNGYKLYAGSWLTFYEGRLRVFSEAAFAKTFSLFMPDFPEDLSVDYWRVGSFVMVLEDDAFQNPMPNDILSSDAMDYLTSKHPDAMMAVRRNSTVTVYVVDSEQPDSAEEREFTDAFTTVQVFLPDEQEPAPTPKEPGGNQTEEDLSSPARISTDKPLTKPTFLFGQPV